MYHLVNSFHALVLSVKLNEENNYEKRIYLLVLSGNMRKVHEFVKCMVQKSKEVSEF